MTKQSTQAPGLVLAGLAVGLGLSLTGYFVADGVRDFKAMDRHVEVKGLAERDVEADVATWVLSYSVSGDDFDTVNAQVDQQGARIRRFLGKHGLKGKQIQAGQILVTDQSTNPYAPPNPGPRFHVRASVIVESDDVHVVSKASAEVNELVRGGILLDATQPTYRFTGLNDIKPAMLAEATRNAREAVRRERRAARGSHPLRATGRVLHRGGHGHAGRLQLFVGEPAQARARGDDAGLSARVNSPDARLQRPVDLDPPPRCGAAASEKTTPLTSADRDKMPRLAWASSPT